MKINEISSPDFLKQLKLNELDDLCADIRDFIVENVAQTGGHLSANLGVVELIVALHYVFNSPHDKFIFDVGHQAYTHKILTGRANEFKSLRSKDGLSGFLKYSESPHDVWEAGHSSTALSAASGFLEAKKSGLDIGEIIAFVGDGALQNGLAFEGLNYIGARNEQKVIIIINDNAMSISKNVGGLANKMSRMRIRQGYTRVKQIVPRFLQRILRKAKNMMRTFVYGDNIFSALGYKYYGPLDGHNLKELITYLNFAKNSTQSIVLHVKTLKGRGYHFAEGDENGNWHGVNPFDIKTGLALKKQNPFEISWSKGISNLLMDEVARNDKIRIISPAMISGASLEEIMVKYPKQVIDVGIAEEHALVMGASLARFGLIPIISIYSTFLQRAYDQLSHDICRSKHHVIFLIDRAGIVPGDGSTHQGVFDIGYLSHLPNMTITAPKNLSEARALLQYALHHQGPIAIRYPKTSTLTTFTEKLIINSPSWEIELPLTEVNILTYGPDLCEYKEKLAGRGVGLINARFIKPLDEEVLHLLNNRRLIIVEEVVRGGSLAMMVLAMISYHKLNITCECYHLNEEYPEIGTSKEIKKLMGIDVDTIISKI